MPRSGSTTDPTRGADAPRPGLVIPRLGDEPGAPFPPVNLALEDPDGLLAWGGDLSPERLLNAYRQGIFPWYSDDDPLLWWSPAQRCVIPVDKLHISRRLARQLRNGPVKVTADRAFEAVVEGCARTRKDTWITTDMARAYTQLHQLGHAHSFEAWVDGELVGGLYGVALGHMFFGESMYSARSNASKIVMARLCAVLREWSFPWLDCQVPNPHLFRLGARREPRDQFVATVANLVREQGRVGDWGEAFDATLAGSSAPGAQGAGSSSSST